MLKIQVKTFSGLAYRMYTNGVENTNENQLVRLFLFTPAVYIACMYVNPVKLNDIGNSHAKCEFLCVCACVYVSCNIPLQHHFS